MTAWVKTKFEVWSNHNSPGHKDAEIVAVYDTKEEADTQAQKINEL